MAGLRYWVAGSGVLGALGTRGILQTMYDLLCTLLYVVSILRGSVICITRLFPSHPSPLCLL